MRKKNHCIDCGKIINRESVRCKSCAGKVRVYTKGRNEKIRKAKLGENNPQFKGGYTMIKKYCVDCGKEISWCSKRCKSCATKGDKNHFFGKPMTHRKGAHYKGIWMRSSWEIAYAKWLDKNAVFWKYECDTFNLGKTTYTPDFYLPDYDRYIEIKGYFSDKAKEKIELFRRLHPYIRLDILMQEDLNARRILV